MQDTFQVHGIYHGAGIGPVEIEFSDDRQSARVRKEAPHAFGPTDWLVIHEIGEGEAIDPEGLNIPVDEIKMRFSDDRLVVLAELPNGRLKMSLNRFSMHGIDWQIEEICQSANNADAALFDILEQSGYIKGNGQWEQVDASEIGGTLIHGDVQIIGKPDPTSQTKYLKLWKWDNVDDFAAVLLNEDVIYFDPIHDTELLTEEKDLTALAMDALILLERLHDQLPDAFSDADQATMLALSKTLYQAA